MKVEVHSLSNDPTAAWLEIGKSQRVVKVIPKPPASETPENKVRIVCMSDTHSLTPYIKFDIPNGDIFIHAGDFTKCGRKEEVIEFNNWIGNAQAIPALTRRQTNQSTFDPIGQLPHKHKLVIAGNHELSFDNTFTHPFQNAASAVERDRRMHTGNLRESIGGS